MISDHEQLIDVITGLRLIDYRFKSLLMTLLLQMVPRLLLSETGASCYNERLYLRKCVSRIRIFKKYFLLIIFTCQNVLEVGITRKVSFGGFYVPMKQQAAY